jgi:protoporphyrinogen oxidase
MDLGKDGVLVLGAGPAGLTAAYTLARQGRPAVVLERDAIVGGLARTEVRDGYRFDLGGHRFFTKSPEIELLWREVLGDELLLRPRLSRIYYRGRFLSYPLRAADVVRKLGAVELSRALGSYLAAAVRRPQPEVTFEQWVSNRFGRRLYEMFFRSYTEKVWGVPCSELRAEWAAQRIRGLSFASAVRSALPGARANGDGDLRSLIEEFHYPRLGPGQMWEAMRDRIEQLGGEVRTEAGVERLQIEHGLVESVTAGGETFRPGAIVSSLPLRTLVALSSPRPPRDVVEAARGLRYRDFVTVALAVDGADPFPDNWIYVHEPGVRVARIQNYRAWSPEMVPDSGSSCVGMEYFCFEGDDLWCAADADLVAMASDEIGRVGLVAPERVRKGWVVRVPKAYPIYDADYAERVALIRGWVASIENLQQVGRNGLHRYNNSDHSMLTAICAIENLDGADHDLWAVNADSWYHETHGADEQPYRRAPETPAIAEPLTDEVNGEVADQRSVYQST